MIERLRFIGALNFYSKYIGNLQIVLKPLYNIIQDSFQFHWNIELEKLFQEIETSITKFVTLKLP